MWGCSCYGGGRGATEKRGQHSREKQAELVLLLAEQLQIIWLRHVCGENRSCSRHSCVAST